MQEITGSLFAHNEAGPDAVCITTNGQITAQGSLVMGRGCAGGAKARWPDIQMIAGERVQAQGNRVLLLTDSDQEGLFIPARHGWPRRPVPYHILTFPTKHHWRDPSDLQLIDRSCEQLAALTDQLGFRSVVLPRPGCGLGRLTWDEVRPICEKWLDERFFIITFN